MWLPISTSPLTPLEHTNKSATSSVAASAPDKRSPGRSELPQDALSVQMLDIPWQSRPGIVITDVKTYGYGVGSEYVYCYSYPTYIEIAELKQEQRFRVKVGMATDDPIGRIYGQVAGNKTAISETPHVLCIFKTLAARHLERWLHKRLERASDAAGSEWFHTNLDELADLFRKYVSKAALSSDLESDAISSDNGIDVETGSVKTVSITAGGRQFGRKPLLGSGLSTKDTIFRLWLDNPEVDPQELAAKFPGATIGTIRKWISRWRRRLGMPKVSMNDPEIAARFEEVHKRLGR